MAIRVPVSPQTRAPQGQVGYERAVDISSGIKAVGDVVRAYGQYVQEEDKKRELFDVQQRLVDEANALQLDFEDRQKKAPIGAPNFTQDINDAYTVRHQELVQDLKSKGYSKDAINEFETRLGVTRSQYVAKAIDFQDKSRFAKSVSDTDQLALSLSQYVAKDPNAIQSSLDELQTAVNSLDLTAPEKEVIFERNKNSVLQSARENYAIQHPEVVLGLYGFPHDLTTTSPTNLPDGQQFDLPNYIKKLIPVEGTSKNPKSSAKGFGQFLESTWLGTYKEVFGNTKETNTQILAKRKDRGVATKLLEKLTNDNIQKLVEANLPVNEATVYLSHFLGAADAIKVLSAHADETIGKLVRAKSINANSSVFNKVKTAGDLVSWANGKFGTQNEEIPQQTISVASSQPSVNIDTTGKTGIPILDLSTGPERVQMLQTARVIMNEREADAKAAQREAHNTYINDFYNKLQDGTYGQADLNSAYSRGLIKDFDERQKAQSIIDAKNKKNEDLARFGLIIHGGFKANPYDPDAQKAVDAGFEKAVELDHKAGRNTSPFLISLDIYNRTGVLPKAGGVMIRGGLIGTDPLQVASAASVASNMLAQNPNAFAGVEGGNDIGIAAATYAHYVDDLGMSAEEAANKIAQQNSPEFKAKVKVDQPQREKFINTITGDKTHAAVDIEKVLSNSILGQRGFFENLTGGYFGTSPQRGKFVSDSQKAEASQTYLELALDAYDKNHDEGAALKYASDQMARFYGVEQGRLMKYPPSKAYPEIQGSRDYIFDQAKKDVDKFSGFSVPKENIWLQPLANGRTADAFRAGRAPPYEVHFFTERDGQRINHVIPGKVFIADVDEAKKDAAEKARKEEQRIRNLSPYVSGPQFGG